ncbi:MAG: PspC domain-containing protein [Lachnospiraceae bacterium]|mgnify:CR=1 FL=1|nr:PspC domain-containing protein [Lachnospiraceae bacterium]
MFEEKKNKRLTKSPSNRMVCGVCAGIGEYFDIDPTVIRLLWAILTVCGVGSGLLVYIIAAVVMPDV